MVTSIFGIRFIKQVHILEKYKELNDPSTVSDSDVGGSWLDDYMNGSKEMKMPLLEFQINDNLDTMIKISDPYERELKRPVIFLFISSNDGFKQDRIKKVVKPQEIDFFKYKTGILVKRKSFFYLHDL